MADAVERIEVLLRVRWSDTTTETLTTASPDRLMAGQRLVISDGVVRIEAVDLTPTLPRLVLCVGEQRFPDSRGRTRLRS